MAADMTVAEFATKHCRGCGTGDELAKNIQYHVDLLVQGAMSTGHSLWKVGIDPDGRVSLLWSTMPEDLWEQLLLQSLAVEAIKRELGL
ncbi:hypothetical protein [Microbacterium sp. gxy059]|uniref:hypothetical protein n=1 Tax=Microbacterium sp. gxy059 TaxID=2957199 RepID=UPI003D99A420